MIGFCDIHGVLDSEYFTCKYYSINICPICGEYIRIATPHEIEIDHKNKQFRELERTKNVQR